MCVLTFEIRGQKSVYLLSSTFYNVIKSTNEQTRKKPTKQTNKKAHTHKKKKKKKKKKKEPLHPFFSSYMF